VTVSSSLMKIWYFLVIAISLSSLSLASAYEITSDSENVIVYRDVSELVLIEGLVPKDIHELYPPIIVSFTQPDGTTSVLEYPVTEERYYNFPVRFDNYSLEGKYLLEISYRTKMFHTVSINVSKSDEFKPISESLAISSTSKFFSIPGISSQNESYFVNMDVVNSNQYDHVKLLVQNNCSGNSEIHSQDYRLTKIDSLEFVFHQISLNKPNTCTLIFSVYDNELQLIDNFFFEYDVNFEEIKNPEKIVRSIPQWTKNLIGFWVYGKISDNTLSNALTHLIHQNIILLDISSDSRVEIVNSPDWFKQNSRFWVEGRITDEKFLIGLEKISDN
jgi:hypothetical protein